MYSASDDDYLLPLVHWHGDLALIVFEFVHFDIHVPLRVAIKPTCDRNQRNVKPTQRLAQSSLVDEVLFAFLEQI